MILEHLEAYLRQQAEIKADAPTNPFRASSSGRCIREGCYDLLRLRPEPLQPRRMLTLEHGTVIHDNLLTPLIKNAMGWRVVSGAEFGDCEFEIDGAKISFHIDLAFQHEYYDPEVDNRRAANEIGVAEIKGWADMPFKKAEQGEIDHEILCQGWTYHHGTSFNPVVFLGFRKETSHMVEIVFDRTVHEKVVTQTLTTDPIAKAKADPILLTEIKSPFDLSVEGYVRDRIKWLKTTQTIKDTSIDSQQWVKNNVPGKDAVEDEIVRVQGKHNRDSKIAEGLTLYQEPAKGGSWWAFKTGRKILGYPCSYCGHKGRCYPEARMEMKGERPVFVI